MMRVNRTLLVVLITGAILGCSQEAAIEYPSTAPVEGTSAAEKETVSPDNITVGVPVPTMPEKPAPSGSNSSVMYTVSFDPDRGKFFTRNSSAGSVNPIRKEHSSGSVLQPPPDPVLAGHAFLGWTTKYADANYLWDDEIYRVLEDMTLYACFQKNAGGAGEAGSTIDSTTMEPQQPSLPAEPLPSGNAAVSRWYPHYKNPVFPDSSGRTGTVTLFAPGVSKDSGWYDTNKSWSDDAFLCWAASSTNAISWWLDRYKEGGGDVSGLTTNSAQIFRQFINNWKNEGYDEKDGVCWYFTGKFSAGKAPANLLNANSGGYLAHLPGVGAKAWIQLDPTDFAIFGNPDNGRPFVDYQMGSYYPDQPLYSLESFSRTIIRQLGSGMILLKVTGISMRGEHAITLWGCDYDPQTGLVSHVYITDSDDYRYELRRMEIRPSGKGFGVEMQNYYVGSDKFGGLADAILLFQPVEF